MAVEGGEAELLAVDLELDVARCGIDMLEALGHGADGRVTRFGEGDVPGWHCPLRIGLVSGRAGEAQPELMAGVAGADDVVAAASCHLDDSVAGDRVNAAALGDRAEGVAAGDIGAADAQLLAVGQLDHDAVRSGVPGTRRVREALRLGGQPVQARDREEAVLGAEHGLVPPVPVSPVLLEGGPVEVLHGHGCPALSPGRRYVRYGRWNSRDKGTASRLIPVAGARTASSRTSRGAGLVPKPGYLGMRNTSLPATVDNRPLGRSLPL